MRSVVIDVLSGREIVAGDEEVEATQPLVAHLTQRLGWKPGQIMTRPQWRVPKTPSGSRSQGYPVDIALFTSAERKGDPDHVCILVECKAPDLKTGIGELKTYLGLEPHARLGIWFNGHKHALVYKTEGGFHVSEYAPIPRPNDPLSPTRGKAPIRYADLVAPPVLGAVFGRLRDVIAAQDKNVNRDEFILNDISNLLICKIADEQAAELDPNRALAFQRSATTADTAASIRRLFNETKNDLSSVFVDERDTLHIDDNSLERIVEELERYRLVGHDRHAVGTGFQVLRPRALKGDEGAYFTPAPLVDCVVSIADPTADDRVIDPACGTGGFLAATLDHVFGRIDATNAKAATKEKARLRWAAESLFAIDKDAVSVKLCKAYLMLLGDGRAHVYRANAVDRSDWRDRTDDLARVLRPEKFDVVVTNPPFGKRLQVSAAVGATEGLVTCRKWRSSPSGWEPSDEPCDQQLGIAFFERNLEMLREGGRMAIVLPETFLFSAGFRWFVEWVCRETTVTHVVDVPMEAFEEFCRAKTCILFVTKSKPSPGHRVVMSYPQTIGQDKAGKPLHKLDAAGRRAGPELDNELGEAVRQIRAATPTFDGNRTTQKGEQSRLRFHASQVDVRKRLVLVPRYWWRAEHEASIAEWVKKHPSDLLSLGALADEGALAVFPGHGSPPGNARNTGEVPYVKVTDLKNWRINENPTNFIHEDVASGLRRRGPALAFGDLVSPARASSNIGQFAIVMPWQTNVVLTREMLVLRVLENNRGLDFSLLLALLSLKVVQAQYEALVLMQTNREDLGDRWRDVRIPIPSTQEARQQIARPVRSYFDVTVEARQRYADLLSVIPADAFGTRP